jgi:hypothetical protein
LRIWDGLILPNGQFYPLNFQRIDLYRHIFSIMNKHFSLPLTSLFLYQFLVATPADLVLRNGKIVTVNEDFEIVQAMAVKDGMIEKVGSNKDSQKWIGKDTELIDLKGKMILPGLIDSHVHPTGASMFEASHEIPPMEDIEDVLEYIRGRAKVVPKGEWIRVSQVFITRLKEQRYPTGTRLCGTGTSRHLSNRPGCIRQFPGIERKQHRQSFRQEAHQASSGGPQNRRT